MGSMIVPHKAERAGASSIRAYLALMQQHQLCTFPAVLDPKWKQCVSAQWLNQSSAISSYHLLRSIFGKKYKKVTYTIPNQEKLLTNQILLY